MKILKKESDEEAGVPFMTLVTKIRTTPGGSQLDQDSLPEKVRQELEKAATQGLVEFKDDIVRLLPAASGSSPRLSDSPETSTPEVITPPSQLEIVTGDFMEPPVDRNVAVIPTRPVPEVRRASTRVRTVPPRSVVHEDTIDEERHPGRQRRTGAIGGRANRHPAARSRSRSRSARRGRSASRGRGRD
ncbi:hypothetical protein pipiens_019341 [Culex pipiens pipiens]|uniref:Uncharacterized protein n=1 Tax=Culex pipiens pipiens TaxID=38569 RepID=A0ABD1DV28_CULPP